MGHGLVSDVRYAGPCKKRPITRPMESLLSTVLGNLITTTNHLGWFALVGSGGRQFFLLHTPPPPPSTSPPLAAWSGLVSFLTLVLTDFFQSLGRLEALLERFHRSISVMVWRHSHLGGASWSPVDTCHSRLVCYPICLAKDSRWECQSLVWSNIRGWKKEKNMRI